MKIKRLFRHYNDSLVGYLPIKIFDDLAGILALKLYVHLFVPAEFGRYGIYFATISILYLMGIGWISMAGFRFSKELATGESTTKENFFSTIVYACASIFLVISVIAVSTLALLPNVLNIDSLALRVGFLLTLVILLLGYSMNQLFINLLLYLDERALNIKLVLLCAILKPILTLVLYYLMNGHIISLILGQGLVDVVLGTIAIKRLGIFRYLSFKSFDKLLLKRFMTYGYPLIGLSLVMFLLNFSDQYIITIFQGDAANGIYKANYTIAASVFTMIMLGMNRSVFPKILKFWNDHDEEGAKRTISFGFKYFIIIAIPASTGLYMMSEYLSKLFLETSYTPGHSIIGIIAFAMVFYGMSEYANKGYELKGSTVPIFIHCMIAAIINMILNIILVPKYGYIVAAYTTLIGFFVYFLLSFFRRSEILRWHIGFSIIIKLLVINGLMVGVIIGLQSFLPMNLLSFIIIIVSAIIVYGIGIMLFGLLKEEIARYSVKQSE